MAKTLQYLKYARKMNEYLKSGYFGIDGHLHIFTEMVSIFFFRFLVKRHLLVLPVC